MTEDPDALAFVKQLGYQAAPVVYTEHWPDRTPDTVTAHHWSGFNADRIKAIIK